MEKQRMILSLIIPAFNEEKIIGKTLSNLKNILPKIFADEHTWEIIVCDNNSTDNTARIAEEQGVKVVREQVNQISKARNSGAGAAKGTWLLFVDADTYPDEKLINDACSLIKKGDYIGCGTTIKVKDGTLFNRLRMERMNPIYKILNLSGGAFILCEKNAFKALNGFSDSLYAFEEVDFLIRLKKYGRKAGKKFLVLSHNPVLTSGRKGEYTFRTMARLFISGIFAPLIFLLNYILPKKLIKKFGTKLLSYWYSVRK